MDIVIIGAGALGAYFGSRFHEGGANVTFLVREKRAKQLQDKGIKVYSPKGDYELLDPKIATSPTEIEHADLVLVSVKGYHIQGTLDSLKTLTEKGAHVLPVLNGIEHISMLQDQLGKDFILGGLSFIISTLNGDGHVIHSSDFDDLIFGPLQPTQTTICQELEDVLEKTTITGTNNKTILKELWKKYMFITAFSGITTATNLSIGPIREEADTFRIAEMILQEMKVLAKAYNVEILEEEVEAAKDKLLNLPAEATSSMHQDRRKGLTLEVDHLQGGAIRLAKAVGVDIPYTETIYGSIKPFEKQ
ncbi:ketopantoate reductase family protein [Virgibacillus necropolis]|uniref:2-dehydropantoate 2-reductase n=1 Tax=Virgibacillus necropolis TaxID=163877 RepID=A0A221MHT6_9BACI|nr:2-dehydropantoate 2-reductase [Virgibacillus necropolis]ASN07169.1 2-dehydropantoate 2-reductase [Virgibacillus necropolis]